MIDFWQHPEFSPLLGAALGIRGRLQIFAVAVAVPLAVVGVMALLGIWNVSRTQLQESVKQQAELATIAFDRWVQAQEEPNLDSPARYQRESALLGAKAPGRALMRNVSERLSKLLDIGDFTHGMPVLTLMRLKP